MSHKSSCPPNPLWIKGQDTGKLQIRAHSFLSFKHGDLSETPLPSQSVGCTCHLQQIHTCINWDPTLCQVSCTRSIKIKQTNFKAAEWLSGNISSEKMFGKFWNFFPLASAFFHLFLSKPLNHLCLSWDEWISGCTSWQNKDRGGSHP